MRLSINANQCNLYPLVWQKVMKGDIFSEEELSAHFRGVDAVVSCLGFQRKSIVTGYSDSIKPIVSAMRIANIQRLVVMTAYYTEGRTYHH